MKNLMDIMKQAQEMQGRMASMQSELEDLTVTGTAGAGMVSVSMNGKGTLLSVSIDPSLFSAEEKEVVEDLIVAAHLQARQEVEKASAEHMKSLTGGIELPPGFKMPF